MAILPTVLIVDDERYTRDLLVELLKLEGYPTETATNGREALEKLAHSGPRVVLLDLMMPVLDGRQMMEELQAQPAERAKHKIILISADYRLEAARDLNPDGMVSKPFTIPVLLNAIQQVSASVQA